MKVTDVFDKFSRSCGRFGTKGTSRAPGMRGDQKVNIRISRFISNLGAGNPDL